MQDARSETARRLHELMDEWTFLRRLETEGGQPLPREYFKQLRESIERDALEIQAGRL